MHTGTPHLTSEGYVGEDVHRAARIAAAGYGGQVLVSTSTASLVETDTLRDLGEHRFKDLAAPERVYQLGDSDFPPLKSLYRTNLPVPATPFLGREQELAEVLELPPHPLGPARHPDRARWHWQDPPRLAGRGRGLRALPGRGLLGSACSPSRPLTRPRERGAGAGGARETGSAPLRDAHDRPHRQRVLLLLDNTEHLLPEVASELAALLATSGPLLLVTRRERLQLQGEQVYPVPTLEERDAVELFLARARALSPGFTAAARTVLFSPEQLIERLAQRLDLLK